MDQNIIDRITTEVHEFFVRPNPVRSVLILVISLLVAFYLSRYLARAIIRIAQFVALRADNTPDELKAVKLRRVETYLSVTIALVRLIVVISVGLFAWHLLSPTARNNTAITAIGAGTVFFVLAGATISPLLRDMTSGSTMIAEGWFNVGDHIKVEPFWDVSGVVERVTLRSTKIRRLNGEVVWLHNQYVQGVHITPKGVRTMLVDVLVRDKEKGLELINSTIKTLPISPTTITKKLVVSEPEEWGDDMWRIIIKGQTPPGREWLLEDYLITALQEGDKRSYKGKIIVHKPMARYSDPDAERNFRRAVRQN